MLRYNPNNELLIIDASNIAFNGTKSPKFDNLVIARICLDINRNKLFFIADYRLFFTLKKRDKNFIEEIYHKWKDEGILIESPNGITADELILEFAWSSVNENPKIISNDKFKEYNEKLDVKWLESNLLLFRIVNNQLFLFKVEENNKEKTKQEFFLVKDSA